MAIQTSSADEARAVNLTAFFELQDEEPENFRPGNNEPRGSGLSRVASTGPGMLSPSGNPLHQFRRTKLEVAKYLALGVISVAVITFAAGHFLDEGFPSVGVGPGTISLLYLIVIVFVSLRGGFVSAVGVSLIAAFSLSYFVRPLVPSLKAKNPLDIVATLAFLITAWVVTGIVSRLREKNALLDKLFEDAPEANALMDLNSRRVVCVNREFTRIFGYTPQETAGRNLSDLILPGESQEEFQGCMERVSQGQRVEAEVVCQRKDGSRLHVLMVSVPVCMPGREKAVFFMCRDITERKEAEAELHKLSGRLLRLVDQQRRCLARDLHDTTAQLLTALSMNLSVVSESADLPNPRARVAMADAVNLVDQCLREVRTISYLLHPRELDELGLESALSRYIDGFTQRSEIRVEVEVSPDLGRLPEDVETAVFRVVQECLTNIHRHSGSSTARLRLIRGPSNLVLEVEDAGHGFRRDAPSGVGIASMRERVQQLNGRLEIASHAGGATVKATIPLSRIPA
jgi:two-component system NarL family sensor kinase